MPLLSVSNLSLFTFRCSLFIVYLYTVQAEIADGLLVSGASRILGSPCCLHLWGQRHWTSRGRGVVVLLGTLLAHVALSDDGQNESRGWLSVLRNFPLEGCFLKLKRVG